MIYKPQGGGTLIFPPYVGSGPASTIHPQKILEISSTPKNILNFSDPKKYPNSVRVSRLIWVLSLSVTSHINCIGVRCLINAVDLTACAFIRS